MIWATLLKIGASLLFQLATESFAKEFAIISLRWAASKSHTEVDDQMVETVAQAWNVKK